MDPINIKATKSNPSVIYKNNGQLLIKGRSIPSDVKAFYQPLIDWAGKLEVKKLTVDINLEYMNSASSKKLLYLLKVFDGNNNIQELSVVWHYDEGDEEILVSGQIFEKLLSKAKFIFEENKDN